MLCVCMCRYKRVTRKEFVAIWIITIINAVSGAPRLSAVVHALNPVHQRPLVPLPATRWLDCSRSRSL